VKIPANAEVAVESVKMSRGALQKMDGNMKFYRFFGELNDVDGVGTTKVDHNSMPIAVVPDKGVYTSGQWGDHLEKKMNESACNPEIWKNTTVTRELNASGGGVGLNILQTQRGSASGKDQSGVVLLTHWTNPNYLSYPGGYVYGLSHVGDNIIRNTAQTGGTEGDLNDKLGTAILGGFPFGLVQGKFEFKITNSSNFRVGLSRPQQEFYMGDKIANLLPGNTSTIVDERDANADYPDVNPTTGRVQHDYFDYMVECNASNASGATGLISVYQTCYNPTSEKLEQTEVIYYHAGNATFTEQWNWTRFHASFDRFAFYGQGDEMSLWAIPTGGTFNANKVEMVGAGISKAANRMFAPVGETRAALYPKITVAKLLASIAMEEYESHYYHKAVGGQNASSFAFPSYSAATQNLTLGDDYYTNNRLARTNADVATGQVIDHLGRDHGLDQTMICDTKPDYQQNFTNATGNYTFNEEIGSGATASGIGFEQALIVGPVLSGTNADYREGSFATRASGGQANLNRELGFAKLSYLNETDPGGTPTPGYVTGKGTAAVTFTSTGISKYDPESAFVRLPNMTLHSYNGNKSNISKILYHIPRFTPDGRDTGNLFFAPGEKTYIKLNNTESFLLNNLDVQIVGVDEIPVKDLDGPTIVVLHVRET
tara:strand:+ start:885 stop:2855 length:1971 start_codon:yes stop_codon:yes gene_type:complete